MRERFRKKRKRAWTKETCADKQWREEPYSTSSYFINLVLFGKRSGDTVRQL